MLDASVNLYCYWIHFPLGDTSEQNLILIRKGSQKRRVKGGFLGGDDGHLGVFHALKEKGSIPSHGREKSTAFREELVIQSDRNVGFKTKARLDEQPGALFLLPCLVHWRGSVSYWMVCWMNDDLLICGIEQFYASFLLVTLIIMGVGVSVIWCFISWIKLIIFI